MNKQTNDYGKYEAKQGMSSRDNLRFFLKLQCCRCKCMNSSLGHGAQSCRKGYIEIFRRVHKIHLSLETCRCYIMPCSHVQGFTWLPFLFFKRKDGHQLIKLTHSLQSTKIGSTNHEFSSKYRSLHPIYPHLKSHCTTKLVTWCLLVAGVIENIPQIHRVKTQKCSPQSNSPYNQ